NDKGTNSLFAALIAKLNEKCGLNWKTSYEQFVKTQKQDVIIPNDRRYYLREIVDTVRNYHKKANQQVELARKLYQLEGSIVTIQEKSPNDALISSLQTLADGIKNELSDESKRILANWEKIKEAYSEDEFVTKIRD